MRNRLQQASLALVGFFALAMPLTPTTVHAKALPDLSPTGISVSLTPQNGACQARIQATIANIGRVDAGAYAISFTVDGALADTRQVLNGTNAGQTDTEAIEVVVTRGTHTVTVVADSLNQVRESNELNNTLSASFTCQ